MEFVKLENSIKCIRAIDNGSVDKSNCVAKFDARLDEVPPHVIGSLTSLELLELESWLNERKKVKDKAKGESLGSLIALVLPQLIEIVRDKIDSGSEIDLATQMSIRDAAIKLAGNIDGKSSDEAMEKINFTQPAERMEQPEVLKVYLDSIRSKV